MPRLETNGGDGTPRVTLPHLSFRFLLFLDFHSFPTVFATILIKYSNSTLIGHCTLNRTTNSASQKMAATNTTSLPERNKGWYQDDLTEVNEPIRKLLETYSKVPSSDVVKHVNTIVGIRV